MSGRPAVRRELRIAIIGAGPGGLCTGKALLDEGIDTFVILEKGDGVGGTWRRNRYPGASATCLRPSTRSRSFKADSSEPFGTQPEILTYMEHVARNTACSPTAGSAPPSPGPAGTRSRPRGRSPSSPVRSSRPMWWSVPSGCSTTWPGPTSTVWVTSPERCSTPATGTGTTTSPGSGSPSSGARPVPSSSFPRSGRWPPRSICSNAPPTGCCPRTTTPYTPAELEAFRQDPTPLLDFRATMERYINKGMTFASLRGCAEREATGLAAIEVVDNQEVRGQLRPTHPCGPSDPDVELLLPGLQPAQPRAGDRSDLPHHRGRRGHGGRSSGSSTPSSSPPATPPPSTSAIDVTGRGGRRIDEAWDDGPIAYLGITTSGFPNLFMLYGPNTNNNGSILTIVVESQVEHVHRPRPAAGRRFGLGRCPARGHAPLQRRGARGDRRGAGLAGRGQRLLPDGQRSQRHPVAVLDDRLHRAHGDHRSRRLRGGAELSVVRPGPAASQCPPSHRMPGAIDRGTLGPVEQVRWPSCRSPSGRPPGTPSICGPRSSARSGWPTRRRSTTGGMCRSTSPPAA